MGGEPYEYFIDYDEDAQTALDQLRTRVFESGEYNGAEMNPSTQVEALKLAGPDGTRSILDILRVSDDPEYCAAAPLSDDELEEFFGTTTPTAEAVQQSDAFWEILERGMARYVVVYQDGQPSKLYFAGYSFD